MQAQGDPGLIHYALRVHLSSTANRKLSMTTPKIDLSAFKPDANQIRAARNLFAAMAHAELVVPIVEAYQREILARHQWKPDARWAAIGTGLNQPLLDPKHSYLMNDTDSEVYFAECRKAQAAAKLITETPDYCPKLVAESIVLRCEMALVAAMEPVTKVGWDLVARDLKSKTAYIGLTLALLSKFVGTASEILGEIVPVPATA